MENSRSVLKYIGYKATKVRWRPYNQELQDSKIFVTGSYDNDSNEISVWEYDPFLNHGDPAILSEPVKICSCTLNAGSTDILFTEQDIVAASSTSGSIIIYKYCSQQKGLKDIHQLKNLHTTKRGIHCCCTCMVSCSLSHKIFMGGEDGKIFVLAVDRLNITDVIGKENTSSLTAICSLQSQILSANVSGQLKLWDLRCNPVKPLTVITMSNNELVSTLCLDKHPNQCHLIVAGCDNGSVCFWDLRQEKQPVLLMSAHSSEVWEARFHPRFPNYLFTCSQDGSLWQWNRSPDIATHIGAASHNKIDVVNLLPNSASSITSFDISLNSLIASSDAEALFLINDLSMR